MLDRQYVGYRHASAVWFIGQPDCESSVGQIREVAIQLHLPTNAYLALIIVSPSVPTVVEL